VHRRAAERDRRDHAAQLPGDQRHVGGLDRDVGPGPDRDPDVGLRQGGGIVDPVTHHRHELAFLLLEATDLDRFVFRQDLGHHPLDPYLPSNRIGRASVVPADHRHLDAERPHRTDRRR
jgi:hypothetical protein